MGIVSALPRPVILKLGLDGGLYFVFTGMTDDEALVWLMWPTKDTGWAEFALLLAPVTSGDGWMIFDFDESMEEQANELLRHIWSRLTLAGKLAGPEYLHTLAEDEVDASYDMPPIEQANLLELLRGYVRPDAVSGHAISCSDPLHGPSVGVGKEVPDM